MSRFITLASSSSGNAAFVGTGQYGVLIDAGVSAKRIKTAMTDAGLDPAFIKAIFVTHEHNDHISGINVLAAQLKVPVYATPGTMAGLNDANVLDGRFPTELLTDRPVVIGDIQITHFYTSHDSRQSVFFLSSISGQRSMYWLISLTLGARSMRPIRGLTRLLMAPASTASTWAVSSIISTL